MAECHHPTCTIEVPADQFACRPHWFWLPSAESNRILRTWRARRAHPADADAVRKHEAAKDAAVAWYRQAEAVKAAKAAGDG